MLKSHVKYGRGYLIDKVMMNGKTVLHVPTLKISSHDRRAKLLLREKNSNLVKLFVVNRSSKISLFYQILKLYVAYVFAT